MRVNVFLDGPTHELELLTFGKIKVKLLNELEEAPMVLLPYNEVLFGLELRVKRKVYKKKIEMSQPNNSNRVECCERQTEIDRISKLPWGVLDSILVRLPIEEAVKTSVLSKEWRYKWLTLSQFAFDSECIQYFREREAAATWDKIKKLVNRFLLRRSDPTWDEIKKLVNGFLLSHSDTLVESFKFAADIGPNNSDLCQWLHFLSKKGVKEFLLENYCRFSFKLPSSLYTFRELRCLELMNCTIKPPPLTFDGFKFLATLYLYEVSIDDDTLESLILCSPILERLTLRTIQGLKHLRIHGPNLKYLDLDLDSNLKTVSFEKILHLRTIDIGYIGSGNSREAVFSLLSALGCMSSLERLLLSGYFLESLETCLVESTFPAAYNHLRDLRVRRVNFQRLHEVEVFLSMLKRFPNLEVLKLSFQSTDGNENIEEFLEEQNASYISFKRLKAMVMKYNKCKAAGFEVLKFLLAHAPMAPSKFEVGSVTYTQPMKANLAQDHEPIWSLNFSNARYWVCGPDFMRFPI
ncbi:hypothetical protein L1049_002483 [Liquidambar formosana]|uniref:F-box/LRR-repeat protein 15/At3g58940/PEG3-like LRR domain-containing protein n=1 Tax=Liquidambar formosana TaxID=63359 RepID=A0AAP0R8W4_LIQFO